MADTMVQKPQTMSFEAAATTPTVYITVFAAFGNGGGMGPGTRVLIHSGTGGVGLAALEVACALGCEVTASAGSAAKRRHLRQQGLVTVVDSRSTLFTCPRLFRTGPLDIVINSLTSPGMLP